MSEERKCPVFHGTSLYKSPACNGKILKKEPILSPEKIVGHLYGPKDMRGGRTGEDDVFYYLYVCENDHTFIRPDWWADVPIVTPGTVSAQGIVNKPPKWYLEMPEEEKKKMGGI